MGTPAKENCAKALWPMEPKKAHVGKGEGGCKLKLERC